MLLQTGEACIEGVCKAASSLLNSVLSMDVTAYPVFVRWIFIRPLSGGVGLLNMLNSLVALLESRAHSEEELLLHNVHRHRFSSYGPIDMSVCTFWTVFSCA